MSRIAGADHLADGGHAQAEHAAVGRCAHVAALRLIAERFQALLELANPGRGLLRLVGRELLIVVARLRDARADLARSLPREREIALAFRDPAPVVGSVALQLQQPRTLHVAFAREPFVDLVLLGRELGGEPRLLDLLFERRRLRRGFRDLQR
jgi:hypothetical protein